MQLVSGVNRYVLKRGSSLLCCTWPFLFVPLCQHGTGRLTRDVFALKKLGIRIVTKFYRQITLFKIGQNWQKISMKTYLHLELQRLSSKWSPMFHLVILFNLVTNVTIDLLFTMFTFITHFSRLT